MAKKPSKAQKKVASVMREFKAGTLNTGKPGPGKGPKVKSRKQAIAIALSEAAKVGKRKKKG
jgi:phosphodiesterase/alkaline phosphatase D-like protein